MAGHATVAVLTYHSIGELRTRSLASLTVAPTLFDEQLSALRDAAVGVIPFAEAPSYLAAGHSAVSITIDDGLADGAEHAAPVLARHGLTATLFVPTAYVGGRARWLPGADGERAMLSWNAIADLARAGLEIGSHGHRHLAADVHAACVVRADALASRDELEDRLGRPIASFAYPFGYQTRAVGDLPARAGDNRWALPRLQIRGGTTPEEVLRLVSWRPGACRRGWAHAKQRVWHAGRRWAGWGPSEAQRVEAVGR